MDLQFNIGDIVRLNGSINGVEIIVAKRKIERESIFDEDYISINDFMFHIVSNSFQDEIVNCKLDIASIKMPDLFTNYNSDEAILKAYNSLSKEKEIDCNKYDFITKEQYLSIIKQIVKNTFKK